MFRGEGGCGPGRARSRSFGGEGTRLSTGKPARGGELVGVGAVAGSGYWGGGLSAMAVLTQRSWRVSERRAGRAGRVAGEEGPGVPTVAFARARW